MDIYYLIGDYFVMIEIVLINTKFHTINKNIISYGKQWSYTPIGDSFMYIGTSGRNFGENVFCSWERTDIIQISNITFYYNRFSIQGDLRAMGRFRIQILTKDNVWLTKFIINKNEQFSDSSTDWIILNVNITNENYGVIFVYDQIDKAHADMCFSNITITYSPY